MRAALQDGLLERVVLCRMTGVLPFPKNWLFPIIRRKQLAKVRKEDRILEEWTNPFTGEVVEVLFEKEIMEGDELRLLLGVEDGETAVLSTLVARGFVGLRVLKLSFQLHKLVFVVRIILYQIVDVRLDLLARAPVVALVKRAQVAAPVDQILTQTVVVGSGLLIGGDLADVAVGRGIGEGRCGRVRGVEVPQLVRAVRIGDRRHQRVADAFAVRFSVRLRIVTKDSLLPAPNRTDDPSCCSRSESSSLVDFNSSLEVSSSSMVAAS